MRSTLPFLLKGFRGLFALALLALPVVRTEAQATTRSYAVEVSATVKTSPPEIALRWPADANATGYTVQRKALSASSWTPMATLGASATSWTDQSVAVGGAYEYAINRSTSAGFTGTGYIYAGIEAPMTESRGKLVFLVDNTHAAALAMELARMQQDFVGDGWTVIRHDVPRTATPAQVKNLISAAYHADPANVKSVFIFGHVAVPYSGNFRPDGHPDHQGAWAADTYYADMNGSWTDSTVNNTSAAKAWNHNVPGDGKFDQSELPSDVELQAGRVDLHNMTCYANKTPSRSELDLLRAYAEKHHAFRHGKLPVERRGLVCDNFGTIYGEAFASTGWRSFAAFFGAEKNVQAAHGTYFSTLKDNGYLWSYGTGGGSYYTCNGVGSSDDFALTPIKSVFTAYLGSYFGDWDNESNFMRASLGSGYVLATAWGGRPHWWFHHMGLGEPIGLSAKISQNNRPGGVYGQANYGTRGVHTALLGDPTLRLHPVIPPSNVAAVKSTGVTVSWMASTDQGIRGYAVYRAASANGPFTRVSGASLLTGTSFVDASGASGQVYMVRAVKLESSGSGTYHNPSQGVFAVAGGGSTTPTPTPAPQPQGRATFVADDLSTGGSWKGKYGSEGYLITQSATNLPAFATVATSQAKPWVWAQETTASSALQTALGTTRIASCWYSFSDMFIQLNLTDGKAHRVSLYLNDFNSAARGETIEILDPAGTVLASRSYPAMVGGIYSTWDLQGNLTIRVRNTGANSVVLSGIFFGPGSTTTPAPLPAGSATFVAEDRTSGGSWKAAYGSEGYLITQSATNLPAYATVAPRDASPWVWIEATDARSALEKAPGPARIASCWYTFGTMSVQVAINDGSRRRVSLYVNDFNSMGRQEAIEAIDAEGNVLSQRTLTTMVNGVYLTWDIQGTVTFRIRNTGANSAVLSGIFFGAAGTATTPPPTASMTAKVRHLGENASTQGAWKGAFGSQGFQVIAEGSNLPSWASIAPAGKTDHVWTWSSTQSAALQKAGAADRLAACWFSHGSFDVKVNIADGQAHKVSFYAVDWDQRGRNQRVEVIDSGTGALLHSTTVSAFQGGKHLSYDVMGAVTFRFVNSGGDNAVVSGWFIDPASAAL